MSHRYFIIFNELNLNEIFKKSQNSFIGNIWESKSDVVLLRKHLNFCMHAFTQLSINKMYKYLLISLCCIYKSMTILVIYPIDL